MYIRICTCMYLHICIHMYKYTYIHIYVHMYTYMYTHTCTHTHIHTYIYMYIYMYTYMYVYKYICTFTHTHTLMYTRNTRLAYEKLLTKELEFPQVVSDAASSLLRGLLAKDPKMRLGSKVHVYVCVGESVRVCVCVFVCV